MTLNRNLGALVLQSVVWTVLSDYYVAILRFAAGIYLARVIGPKIFGEYGMAVAIIVVLGVFLAIGDEILVLRRRGQIGTYLGVQLTLRLALIVVIGGLLGTLWLIDAGPVNRSNTGLVVALYIAFIPGAIFNIHLGYMNRRMLFKKIAGINAISATFGLTVGVTLAFLGQGLWALMWGLMAERLCHATLIALVSPVWITPRWNSLIFRDIVRFSRHALTANIAGRAYARSDDLAVGGILGATSLGLYQRAYAFGSLVQRFTLGGLSSVLKPTYARLKNQPEQLASLLEASLGFVTRVGFAAYGLLAVIIWDVILVLYGEAWSDVAIIFRALLPFAFIQTFNYILRPAIMTVGSPAVVSRTQLVEVALLLLLLFPLILVWGSLGAAIAVDLSAVVGMLLLIRGLPERRSISLRWIFTNPVIAAVGAIAISMVIERQITGAEPWVRILVLSAVYMSVFAVILLSVEFRRLRTIADQIMRARQYSS